MPGLTIGIDARAATEVPAGRGRMVRELLLALAAVDSPHEFRLYAREPWGETLDERFRWEPVDARDPWWHLRTARRASRECDVFLSSNSYLTTWFLTIPSVAIVCDMVAFDAEMRPNRRSALIERLTLPLCVRRAAGLVAISQATADALVERFPRAAGRVSVALLGASPALSGGHSDAALPAPGFILAVGTLEPRKNLPRLVAAYRSLSAAEQDRHPLVVVGELGWETGETMDALHALGERCRLMGYLPDADLAELYRRCGVFCYPSLGEGFGLPVLEAMAAGAAVVTSDLSSLPEVGGDAVEYADPRDVASIAAALRRALAPNRRAQLGELARARAAQFSWERTARDVLRALERIGRPS
jgi:glycosyltransferase involved in cell wall biosynthesis